MSTTLSYIQNRSRLKINFQIKTSDDILEEKNKIVIPESLKKKE